MSRVNAFFSNPIYISREHEDFVKLLSCLGKQEGDSYSILSYLSSLHFPKSMIIRFYQFTNKKNRGNIDYINFFDKMKKQLKKNIKSYKHYVIYPKNIVEKFIYYGQIHSPYEFFASPVEISTVVNNIIILLTKEEKFNVALTKEIVPFIFVVKKENVIIDVKENIISQKIQGVAIRNQEIANYFKEEFERIWNSRKTMNKKDVVIQYLKDQLNNQRYYGGIKIQKSRDYE